MSYENTQDKNSTQAKKYHKIKNFLFVANTLILIGLLLFFAVLGLSEFLRAYLRMFLSSPIILNSVFFLIFYVLIHIIIFPLDLYEGYIVEHQFKLSRQKFFGWFKDYLKKNSISILLTLIIVLGIYKLIAIFYSSWWIYAAFLWLIITVLFTKVFPLIILPLFFKSRPLPDGELKKRLVALAEKFNFNLSDIFILELSKKTIKANAMVTGLGKSKRIYLSDTLLDDFSQEEIEIVVAHELTHNRNKDILKHLLVTFFISMLCFYVCDLFLSRAVFYFGYISKDDIANLPIMYLLITITSFVVLPLQNAFSRHLEKNADIGSIEATNNADVFISMITKLGKKNLAEFEPSKIVEIFNYDHPPISKRIQLAQKFLQS